MRLRLSQAKSPFRSPVNAPSSFSSSSAGLPYSRAFPLSITSTLQTADDISSSSSSSGTMRPITALCYLLCCSACHLAHAASLNLSPDKMHTAPGWQHLKTDM